METEEILAAIQKAAETIATPNWAAIASVAISLLAVIVAGFVAWKQTKIAIEQNKIAKKQSEIAMSQTEISEQQNKIALFEMRFNAYQVLTNCMNFADISFEIAKSEKGLYLCFLGTFVEGDIKDDELNIRNVTSQMVKIIEQLQQTQFLFSEEISDQILELLAAMSKLIHIDIAQDGAEKFQEQKKILHEMSNSLKSNGTITKMREMLRL